MGMGEMVSGEFGFVRVTGVEDERWVKTVPC